MTAQTKAIRNRIAIRNQQRGVSILVVDRDSPKEQVSEVMDLLSACDRDVLATNAYNAKQILQDGSIVSQLYIFIHDTTQVQALAEECCYHGIPCYVYKEDT